MKFFISRSGLEYITRHLDREKFYNLLSDRLKKLQNFEIEQKKEFFVSKFTVTVKEVNTGCRSLKYASVVFIGRPRPSSDWIDGGSQSENAIKAFK